jgi:hypothetical protein
MEKVTVGHFNSVEEEYVHIIHSVHAAAKEAHNSGKPTRGHTCWWIKEYRKKLKREEYLQWLCSKVLKDKIKYKYKPEYKK